MGRVVGPGEPIWLRYDRQIVLAWMQRDREHCGGCGGLKAETFDPKNEWAYQGEVLVCARCAAMRRAEKKIDNLDGAYSYAFTKEGWGRA